MAKRFRIRALKELYPDFEARLVHVVNQYGEEGQKVAADIFGISQPTVSSYLKANGYRRIIRYEKADKAS